MINRIKIFLISLFIAKPVFAQEEWSLQVDWPASPVPNPDGPRTVLTASSGIAELVQYFFEWSIVLGIILTFGILVYASFKYIVSTGNPQKLSRAKNLLSSAFLGLLLLFTSWLLLSILNPELTRISKISPPNIPTEEDPSELELKTEKELCDYGIVSYISRKYETKEKTILEEGESKIIPMDPYQSIVCKEKEGFNKDIVENETEEAIRFIKGRRTTGIKNPVCPETLSEEDSDCASDRFSSCEEEIMIPLEGNEDMPKYCYDRQVGESVLYISQKPNSSQTTCLAGDKIITDGGGCTLNLYEDQMAGGCGKMITSTNSGGDVASSYDRDVECIEIIRNTTPVPEGSQNTDFAH